VSVSWESLFIGFEPTSPVIESMITKLTQSLLQIDRRNDFEENYIKRSILQYIILNIECIKRKNNSSLLHEWIALRDYILS